MILHLRRFFGRVSAVLVLLLVTQLSFAGHLCLSIAARGQVAESSAVQLPFQSDDPIAPRTAAIPCCPETPPALMECVADPYRIDFGTAVRSPVDYPPIPVVSGRAQWPLASTVKASECSGFSNLPRRPLSILFCRFLD